MSRGMRIGSSIRNLTKIFTSTMHKDLKELGLTPAQITTLRQVYFERKTIGQISENTQLSYSTVSGIIDRLERDGWLERIRDESDRRIVWIQKNAAKVEAVKEKLHLFQESFYENLLADLPEHELDNIIRSLELLTTYLQKKVEEKS
ncbi:MarR family winged helix-turn-helix transcriptional regulator [Paenibacillus xerothermodurans]|uniref:MarR family transcriptional regulator n=1 Tax=Paenibacillus xerothermodurans TaxID=1977292 RepID=A0A2W1NLS9_PAEXE|nr:MarR family transcriptional regulator [Paenibacillus xerothermodurans]PZE19913.1 MarR family transcriptional regulator [Paenibacillus xerothermodurans]